MISTYESILLPVSSVRRHSSIFLCDIFAQVIECCHQCEVTGAVLISDPGSDYD